MAHKRHILIVDDNFINRQFFSMALKKANFDISTAEDGYDAIEQSSRINFDLILMDIRMPEIDGYETANHIRILTNHLKTPIIATSAEDISFNKKSYFNSFLLKPISPKLLSKKIHETLDLSKKIIFNQKNALKFAYNDKKIMNRLIKMFAKDLPFQINLLDVGINQNNTRDCIDIIHKIRGSCKSCGAQELDKQLGQLSVCIKNKGINSSKNNYEKTKIAVGKYLDTIG